MALRTTILFLLAAVVAGCSSRVAPTTTTDTQKKIEKSDSTWSDAPKIVKRDTIIVPGKTIVITKFIHCDSANHIAPFEEKDKKGNATIDLSIDKDGKLTAIVSCDSLQRVIEQQQQLIHQLHKEKETTITKTEKTIPVITHEPYWFDIAARWIASIVLLLIAGYLIYSYFKFKNKII